MQHVSGLSGEVFAWVVILAGLAVLASLIVRIDRRRHQTRRTDATHAEATQAEATQTEATLDRSREWEQVMRHASQGLSRGDELAALQADTAVKIASAEHAYNRLVADCSRLCGIQATPSTPETATQPVGKPETPSETAPIERKEPAEPQPLAA
jgi:hypothetical protein